MDNNSLKHFYDALIAARAIQTFIAGKTFDDYLDDDLLSAGVERKFEIIGEAFKGMSHGLLKLQGDFVLCFSLLVDF